ncbi:MAG: DUF3667 domain-containing protein [Rudaea sp.]
MTTPIDPLLPEPATPPPVVTVVCSNCGAELRGEYCFNCGQPVKGMIRPLSSMLHDVADTIFNIDSRIFRTLWPLLIRPGYLSNEYFAGRRVRFVTPFRLYFFLSIAAFFAMQLWIGDMNLGGVTFDADGGQSTSFAKLLTPEEVIARRDSVIAGLESAKAATGVSAKATSRIERSEGKIRDKADQRIQYLKGLADAKAKGVEPPNPSPDVDEDNSHLELFGTEWDEKKNPVHIGWLPEFANARLNSALGRMRGNSSKIESDPKPFIVGIFGVLPQVLFVVMPLFALLLKIFFIFKRRLYMEHLIIALHSHSFIFFALLLITGMSALHGWAETAAPWLSNTLGVLIFILGWWIPIYLFLMQKKVYKQGWILTTLKFGVIGICYLIIISLGAVAAFLVSLATT